MISITVMIKQWQLWRNPRDPLRIRMVSVSKVFTEYKTKCNFAGPFRMGTCNKGNFIRKVVIQDSMLTFQTISKKDLLPKKFRKNARNMMNNFICGHFLKTLFLNKIYLYLIWKLQFVCFWTLDDKDVATLSNIK